MKNRQSAICAKARQPLVVSLWKFYQQIVFVLSTYWLKISLKYLTVCEYTRFKIEEQTFQASYNPSNPWMLLLKYTFAPRPSHIQTNTCKHTHTYVHTYIHTCIHTCIHTYVHTYIRTYIHAYIYTYIHTYIHAYIHTYVHTYINIYIYTYIYK